MALKSESTESLEVRLRHWDDAYKNSIVPPYPSQFAVFACDFLKPDQNIVEFGCGSGRDSLFFAWQAFSVIGLDGSEVAIERCRTEAERPITRTPDFRRLLVEGSWKEEDLREIASDILSRLDLSRPTMVYARFFLHILTIEEQTRFLDLLMLLARPGTMYAFEFRTHRDQGQSKIAQPHYRRFINPIEFIEEIKSRSFKVEYFIESFGLAKYKTEDAHIARVIFQPQNAAKQP